MGSVGMRVTIPLGDYVVDLGVMCGAGPLKSALHFLRTCHLLLFPAVGTMVKPTVSTIFGSCAPCHSKSWRREYGGVENLRFSIHLLASYFHFLRNGFTTRAHWVLGVVFNLVTGQYHRHLGPIPRHFRRMVQPGLASSKWNFKFLRIFRNDSSALKLIQLGTKIIPVTKNLLLIW